MKFLYIFTVHFPGEVVGGNGAPMERSANGTYSLDHLCDLPVEMVAVSKPGFPGWSLAVGGALVAGLGILAIRVLRKRPAA